MRPLGTRNNAFVWFDGFVVSGSLCSFTCYMKAKIPGRRLLCFGAPPPAATSNELSRRFRAIRGKRHRRRRTPRDGRGEARKLIAKVWLISLAVSGFGPFTVVLFLFDLLDFHGI